MTDKEYKDGIEMINDIISKTRTETKTLIESLEKLKRFYKWEHKVHTGEIKRYKKRIIKWKKNKLIQKDICFDCGSNENIQYHHVVPDTLGGSQTIPLCGECHGKVHNRKFVDISTLVKQTLQRKKDEGFVLGRPTGTKKTDTDILSNPKYKKVIDYVLTKKYSIREMSRMTNVSVGSVLKISKLIRNNPTLIP